MTVTNQKPVIFLAFANDRQESVRYLRNLAEEAGRLQRILGEARRAGLCDLVPRQNVTLQDVLDVFQDPEYRNRIAIFHFGGHANGYQLFLASAVGRPAPAYAGGLAAFLGQQTGLQLVFLNGCSTEAQAQGLLEAGVRAVIVTAQAIVDEVAVEFATHFYQGLCGKASLRTAYNEATAAIRTARGDHTRALYWAEEVVEDRWPWSLYLRPGDDAADQWSLPAAVAAEDPLFGLPPLPPGDLPARPFRRLEWFDRPYAEVFFGRNRFIRALYERVTDPAMAPIVLLYGQSGVGKSSLLAAGLLPRLEGEYQTRYLRRSRTHGLLGVLQAALSDQAQSAQTSEVFKTSEVFPLAETWLALEAQGQKPVVIILDQVEEVYTRPDDSRPHELAGFLAGLQTVFADRRQRPQGKLILSFRKEWLAEIEGRLEQSGLPYTKVFLERLDRRGIIEAIEGPARSERLRKQYGLTVEPGLAEIIADNLLEDRDSAIAPTLQILLTKMWEQTTQRDEAAPFFDLELYQQLKREGILLKDFLKQQLTALEQWRVEVAHSGLALDVLAYHTTPLGAAELRTAQDLSQTYRHQAAIVQDLVQQCKDLYVLVDPARNQPEPVAASRLAHDALAPLVRASFDESDLPGQRARRILESRAVEWEEGQTGAPLDETDLALVEQGQAGMRAWTEDEERLIKASRAKRARLGRNRKIWWGAGIMAILFILLFAGVALWQWQSAEQQARLNKARELAALAINSVEEDPEQSIILAMAAVTTTYSADRTVTTEAEQALYQTIQASRVRHTLRSQAAVWDVAISPNGRWLATASVDSTVRLWDLTAAAPIQASDLLSNTTYVSAVAFNPDGSRLAVANAQGEVQLWDTTHTPARLQNTFSPHADWIMDLAFSPDGQLLATSSKDGLVKLLDAETGEEKDQRNLLHPLCGLAFNRNGEYLAIGGEGGVVKLWALATGEIQDYAHGAASVQICGVGFNPRDDTRLATGGTDSKVQLWNLTSKQSLLTLEDHTNTIWSVAFSPDGEWLATGSFDNTAKLWNVASGRLHLTLSGHQGRIRAVTFSPDGQYLVTASEDNTAKIWDLGGHHQDAAHRVVFSPNGSKLATASSDGTTRVWTTSGKQLARFDDQADTVWDVAFDPDGLHLATVGDDGIVRVRNIDTAEIAYEVSLENEPLFAVAFSPNKPLLAAAGWKQVFLLEADTGQVLGSIPAHEGEIYALAFHPDGELLASGGQYGQAVLLDINQNKAVEPPLVHAPQRGIRHLAFSPNKRYLATASTDNSVKVWDIERREMLFEITGHEDVVTGVTFSQDGLYLITTSADRTARVWDISQISPEQTLETARLTLNHPDAVNGLALSPNEPLLVTVGADGVVRFWPFLLDIEEMVTLAQTRITH